ncbi:ABC transporter substrate-binding protein [Streptomyces sp. B21-083]|uniref:ABC transporter substrate-binding protein n=1 Tax=Streptomyces sp. B21-083 TaxID=3039410 RepID=UPI002FF0483E
MSMKTSTRFRSGSVLLIAIGLAASACGSGDGGSTVAAGSSASTVTFAFQPASSTACLKVTDERGIFRKHGITMKYGTAAPNAAGQVAQILNGQITAGAGAYTAVLNAVSSKLALVITSGLEEDYKKDGQSPTAVMVGKNSTIKSFEQLEGKTVAVNSLQGSWEVLLKESVAKSGGDPTSVKLVAVPFPDQATALKSGRVDAVYTLQPFVAQLMGEGFKDIGDPFAVTFEKPDAVQSVTFMAKKFVDANPIVAKNFVAALQEGDKWCNAHPDDMKKAIARITKVSQQVVDETPLPVYDAGIDPAETKTWGELLVKYGILKKAPAADAVQWSGVPAK